MARFPLFISGLFYSYRLVKAYKENQWLTRLLVLITVGLLIEYSWVKHSEYRGDEKSEGRSLSLMTYNLYFKNKHKESSVKIILNANVDLLVLQEITLSWNAELSRSIGHIYPYSKVIALNGTHGTGIYSKYPLTDHTILNNSAKLPIAQVVNVGIGDKKLRLINAHLASPAIAVENPDDFFQLYMKNYEIRKSQLDRINTLVMRDEKEFDCHILIGDLNTSRYEPIFRDLTSYWYNLSNITKFSYGANFPNSAKVPPVLSLDYILLRGQFTGEHFSVVGGGGSDHLAIKGTVKI